jgi:serine/threonine protein kinase
MASLIHCPDARRWRHLLEGSLPEAEQTELKAHLETCGSCQQEVEAAAADRESWVEFAGHLATPLPELAPVLRHAMEELKAKTGPMESVATDDPLPPNFFDPSADPDALGRLGHYEVSEVLGRGGMGIVLKAFDPLLHRSVAIKVMAPQLAGSAAARKRFAREAQAAASIRHENVVGIYGVQEWHGLPYLVMEYVDGVSLEEHLRRTGPLPLEDILRIGAEAAAGLDVAHMRGLIHRDIKPGNILLQRKSEIPNPKSEDKGTGPLSDFGFRISDFEAKVADFGLARALTDPRVTQSGLLVGTPQYMAPEQARGDPPDHRADLFSLGSVLYAICTGCPPFRADNTLAVLRCVTDDTPTPVCEINPAIPDWLAAVIDRLHCKDPGDRFQTAGEVAEMLRQGLAHVRQPAHAPAPRLTGRESRARSQGAKPMSLVPCEECGKPISDRAYACPHCGLRRLVGYEYRSQTTIFGWPLLHVAFGRDLATNHRRVARGIIAVGDIAIGLVAIGGGAIGGLAIGGGAIGLIALGGGAVGLLLAMGGVAVGGLAIGGAAIGWAAIGGGAFGYYALGGEAQGIHAYGGRLQDPAALEFFRHLFGGWAGPPE